MARDKAAGNEKMKRKLYEKELRKLRRSWVDVVGMICWRQEVTAQANISSRTPKATMMSASIPTSAMAFRPGRRLSMSLTLDRAPGGDGEV